MSAKKQKSKRLNAYTLVIREDKNFGDIIMAMSTYEQVLNMTKHLELPEQLQLLEALSRIVRNQVEKSSAHSIMELEGLGAEIWKDVNAQTYINEERASWDT